MATNSEAPSSCPECHGARYVDCDECGGYGDVPCRCSGCQMLHAKVCTKCRGGKQFHCSTCAPTYMRGVAIGEVVTDV